MFYYEFTNQKESTMAIERPEWDAPYAVWQSYCDHLNTVKFGNAVPDFDNSPDFGDSAFIIEVFDLLTNNLVDFTSSYRFHDFL